MGIAKSQLRVDKLLSNISVRYKNENFIANEVFPKVAVKKESDVYRTYDRDFRLPETIRSAKGVAREHNFDVSTAPYVLEQHSLKDYVSDRDQENYEISDLRRDTTEILTEKILMRKEKSVADLFTSTSWSQNVSLSAAQQFSANTTTSNPIPIFDTAATVVLEQSGMMPNMSIIPWNVMVAIKNHTSVIDRVKYTNITITKDIIGALLSVENMLVPKSVIDTAAEGLTESVSALWGDNAFVGYKAPRPSNMAPSAGYIFENALPLVKRWRDEDRQSEAIEVNQHYSPKVVASLAGYLIKDAL